MFIIDVCECQWKHHLTEIDEFKSSVRSICPFKRALTVQKLLSNIRSGKMFGCVQSDIPVPDILKQKVEAFPPNFENTLVSRSDFGECITKYAEENKLLTQPLRMLITSFQLINGSIVTPLVNFYLHIGLKSTQIDRFVEMFQELCSVCSERTERRRWKIAFKRRSEDYEDTSKTFIRISNKGQELSHLDKLTEWWKSA